jgi:HEAT repeat protein
MDRQVMTDDVVDLLRRAMIEGSPESLEAWAATGIDGLNVLHDELTGKRRTPTPEVHERLVIDNLAAAAAVIAERHPAAFLDTFADPAFDEDGFVLVGLGRIPDETATRRLVSAATSPRWNIRMQAAIGLKGRTSPDAQACLRSLSSDPDELVRHHAEVALHPGPAPNLSALEDLQ